MRELRLLPQVADDVARAADWYDEKGYAGLGDRFLGVFNASLPQIQRHGELHRSVYMNFR